MGIRVALVTQGYQTAGGIQTAARWLASSLVDAGHTVSIFDLATSRRDKNSRRAMSIKSWFRSSLLSFDSHELGVVHVGANVVEIEPMRYLPRGELTTALKRFDIVQVVSGGAALGLCAVRSQVPIILQVATRVTWKRNFQNAQNNSVSALRRRLISTVISLLEAAALKRASCVLVMNPQMSEYASAVGARNVILAPPGIDTTFFRPDPKGWNQTGYLLSVCRFNDPRKGLDRLIRAYAIMLDQQPNVPPLVLAGRGALPPNLRQLIRVSALPNGPQFSLTSLRRSCRPCTKKPLSTCKPLTRKDLEYRFSKPCRVEFRWSAPLLPAHERQWSTDRQGGCSHKVPPSKEVWQTVFSRYCEAKVMTCRLRLGTAL